MKYPSDAVGHVENAFWGRSLRAGRTDELSDDSPVLACVILPSFGVDCRARPSRPGTAPVLGLGVATGTHTIGPRPDLQRSCGIDLLLMVVQVTGQCRALLVEVIRGFPVLQPGRRFTRIGGSTRPFRAVSAHSAVELPGRALDMRLDHSHLRRGAIAVDDGVHRQGVRLLVRNRTGDRISDAFYRLRDTSEVVITSALIVRPVDGWVGTGLPGVGHRAQRSQGVWKFAEGVRVKAKLAVPGSGSIGVDLIVGAVATSATTGAAIRGALWLPRRRGTAPAFPW